MALIKTTYTIEQIKQIIKQYPELYKHTIFLEKKNKELKSEIIGLRKFIKIIKENE